METNKLESYALEIMRRTAYTQVSKSVLDSIEVIADPYTHAMENTVKMIFNIQLMGAKDIRSHSYWHEVPKNWFHHLLINCGLKRYAKTKLEMGSIELDVRAIFPKMDLEEARFTVDRH